MMRYHDFRAMNSDILLAAEGAFSRTSIGFKEVQDFIEACEKRFTRFSDHSELSRLNESAGTWFHASEDLFSLLSEARNYFEQTNGLFDPSVLEALEFAGYDRSMDEIKGRAIASSAVNVMPRKMDLREIRFDRSNQAIRLPPGMRVDLGGIAKGWIAERAAGLLAFYSDACTVSAGGDLYVIGLPEGKSAWQVGLEDPLDPNRTIALLKVTSRCAVATSAITKRRWTLDGHEQHHLIDPRTGEPAVTDWLSVTVIAPHATTAEVYAKTLLIAGSHQAKAIIARSNQIAVISVDGNGKLWGSYNSKEFIDGEN
jgi:thiamine biosynthesis lipoprotein